MLNTTSKHEIAFKKFNQSKDAARFNDNNQHKDIGHKNVKKEKEVILSNIYNVQLTPITYNIDMWCVSQLVTLETNMCLGIT